MKPREGQPLDSRRNHRHGQPLPRWRPNGAGSEHAPLWPAPPNPLSPRWTATSTASDQPVLVETAVLHDEREVTALVLEQAEIPKRVAVDENEVRESAGLDDPELAVHPNDLGRDRGRRADDLDRRGHLRTQKEFAALLVLEGPQQIAAIADLDAGLLAQFEGAQAPFENNVVLGE